MLRALSRFRSLLLLVAASAAAVGQEPTTPPPQDPETTVEAIQTRLDAVNADATLTDAQKAALGEPLKGALENAKVVKLRQEAIQRYADQQVSVADRLAKRQQELQALEAEPIGPPATTTEQAALEQGFASAQADQTKAQQRVAELDAERARRAERRTAIPQQLAAARQQLAALPAQPAEQPDADPRLAAARRLALATNRARVQAEIDALQAELATYDAEVELLRTESDLAARRATTTKANAEAWLAKLQPIRERNAEIAAIAAREEAMRADPKVAPIAKENARLADVAKDLAASRAKAERDKSDREEELQRLKAQFADIKRRVDIVGADESIGPLLRKRRAQLDELSRRHQQRTKSRRDRITDAQIDEIDYEELRTRLVEDPQGWLKRELGGEDVMQSLSAPALAAARLARDARRDKLQELADGYRALSETEQAVETTEGQLTTEIAAFRAYITEHVLGIRSGQPLWRLDWRALGEALAWFGDPAAWTNVFDTAVGILAAKVWPVLLLLLLLVALGLRRPLRRRLAQHGERAARGTNVAYLPTALAAIDTVLLCAPLPAALLLFGRLLAGQPDASELTKAVANGLIESGLGLGLVLFLRALVQPKGLAESHFQWQTTTVALLRRNVPLLVLAVVPFAFGLAALETVGPQWPKPAEANAAPGATDVQDAWMASLGGLLLLAQLSLCLVVGWRLMHPGTGIIGGRFKPVPGVLYRFRRMWFLLTVATLGTLLIMAALGYAYTAQQLASRAFVSFAALLGSAVVYAMVLRGLLLERRRLQIQRAQTRLQAAKDADAGADAGYEVDPQLLARQTQALLGGILVIVAAVLLYEIWVDVLPALGALRQVPLWDIGTEAAPQQISLADLLVGAFLIGASVAAARNLPALLELLVLQRLRMQPGERTAITTLARYAIIIVGVLWSFSSIGIGWSKVQWLVAAVSVGLGFGLQEIFANFVSGLILLFERPIRVGDLVTIGDTVGRVARIQIRATTIIDWNRKELVVPNREFVTSSFVNWTLGDSTVRYIVPVGVAYGSDTALAIALLKKVALESPRILKDPEPNAYFVGFGDSTLNLELRVFVDIDVVEWHWMTEIHQAIDAAFKAAGIEIAFPQRDVHLKLPEPVMELLRQGTQGHRTEELPR